MGFRTQVMGTEARALSAVMDEKKVYALEKYYTDKYITDVQRRDILEVFEQVKGEFANQDFCDRMSFEDLMTVFGVTGRFDRFYEIYTVPEDSVYYTKPENRVSW